MPPSVPYVLVADWTASGSRLAEALRARGHHTILVRESSAAVALAQSRAPVAVVSELRFSDGTGFDVIEAMRAIDATVPVVIVTAYASTASAFAVIRMGARDCLCKPATPDEVLACSGLERNIEARVAPLAWPTLAAVAQRYIQDTCELAGSITKAARLLGVDRRSLKRRMARYARLSVTGERSLDTDRLLPPHATAAAARRKNRPL
jgi:two-component system response regulator RegA